MDDEPTNETTTTTFKQPKPIKADYDSVEETCKALRTMGSDFTEMLADVLHAARHSGSKMAHSLIRLRYERADKTNALTIEQEFSDIYKLGELTAEERVFRVVMAFLSLINEQRELNDLEPLGA